jgi:carbon monoxide dehydrogenase subunit G
MNLTGEFAVKRPRAEVYRFLINPECFGKVLPDLESIVVHGPSSFEAVVRVGISFIKGPLRIRFDLVEAQDGERARYNGKGAGIGSFVDLQAGFVLKDKSDGETEVTWEGVATTGGRIATVASGILMQVAKKNANAFIGALKNEIERSV